MSDPKIQPPRRAKNRLPGQKLRDADKVELIPLKAEPEEYIRKPPWIRIRLEQSDEVNRIKGLLRENNLSTVCEEANCPNLNECFGGGTATFMIMGDVCTRRCPFCDVGHGKPNPLDTAEPEQLAKTVALMKLNYVVITSVDRDDLRDGGAQHFADCIRLVREQSPGIQIEVLTPDFRGRMQPAIDILAQTPPDVFNHNMETIPRLYAEARPGANYEWSLELLKQYRQVQPNVLTKSGLMVGMGETKDELLRVLDDMREHDIQMLTIGQYLQPSKDHYPLRRYVHPDEFAEYEEYALSIGFAQAACGPLVRSSYHADQQARGEFPGAVQAGKVTS
jgi:lipoyl synthase